MNQKAQQSDTQDKLQRQLKLYREALQTIAKHDGISSNNVPGSYLAKIAKDALEAK